MRIKNIFITEYFDLGGYFAEPMKHANEGSTYNIMYGK